MTFMTFVAALFLSVAAFAQDASATWKVEAKKVAEETFRVSFTGTISQGRHIYGVAPEMGLPFEVNYASDVTAGPIVEESTPTDYNGEPVFFNKAVFSQEVTAPEGTKLEGTLTWQACTDDMCGFPEEYEFSVTLGKADAHSSAIGDPEKQESAGGLWALLLEAILWGLAMLLTPCVFPMVPMTVSFFLKASDNVHQGRFKAFMYGVFIVLLYTVPVVLLFGLTRLIGGEAVTACPISSSSWYSSSSPFPSLGRLRLPSPPPGVHRPMPNRAREALRAYFSWPLPWCWFPSPARVPSWVRCC